MVKCNMASAAILSFREIIFPYNGLNIKLKYACKLKWPKDEIRQICQSLVSILVAGAILEIKTNTYTSKGTEYFKHGCL